MVTPEQPAAPVAARYSYRGRAILCGLVAVFLGMVALAENDIPRAAYALMWAAMALDLQWRSQASMDDERKWRVIALVLVLIPVLVLAFMRIPERVIDGAFVLVAVVMLSYVLAFKAIPGFLRERREQS